MWMFKKTNKKTKENMELIITAVNRWFLCGDAAFHSHVFKPPEDEHFSLLEWDLFFFFFLSLEFEFLTLSSTAAAATTTLF